GPDRRNDSENRRAPIFRHRPAGYPERTDRRWPRRPVRRLSGGRTGGHGDAERHGVHGQAQPVAYATAAAGHDAIACLGGPRRAIPADRIRTGTTRSQGFPRYQGQPVSNSVRIAIVGSGPSGLSCASHAAELNVPHVLLEAEEHPSHTIFRYQKGKHVMAEPGILPLRSPMSFTAGKREAVLAKWNEELQKYKVNLKQRAQVTAITGSKGAFDIKTATGEALQAETVVLCIGLQGNIRKLGVAGEDLERVQYQLDDPDEYNGETIVVVGAGDAGIENALGLAENNRVILINRVDEFPRVKQGNIDLVTA